MNDELKTKTTTDTRIADEALWLNPDAQPLIQIQGLSKNFSGITAVNNIDLNIYKGELFTILGGSGCGKTTLLRMLGGFEYPTEGKILIDGTDMASIPPYERPVNMMFQSYALFPHMTVEQNVAYGLKKDRVPGGEIKDRVAEMLQLVKLSSLAQRKPHKLSGGECQRVALARALIKRPKLLLLDEPLAALDKKLREHTQFELMSLQAELNITFIVVTHDQQEAMTLSTRIAVMNQGSFEQVGTPEEVYEYPTNRFVANFIGNINFLKTTVVDSTDGLVKLKCAATRGGLTAHSDQKLATGSTQWLAVRPEKLFINKEPPSADGRIILKGIVLDLGYFGNLSVYRVQLPTGTTLQVSAQNRRHTARRTVEWDDEVYVSWDIASAILLDH